MQIRELKRTYHNPKQYPQYANEFWNQGRKKTEFFECMVNICLRIIVNLNLIS